VLGRPGDHQAVANIGVRPTLDAAGSRVQVEVHLLDFDSDLYGAQLEFFFAASLRGERKFESGAALARQITSDIAAARSYLATWRP
jgi:riboflavin kinase/FMN adenylyltransferase